MQIISSVAFSSALGLFGITNNSPNAAFILGDSTANNLTITTRPAGAAHHFVNNSTNASVINPSVRWQAGGGAGYTCDFSGTGNWIVNSYLVPVNGAFSPNFIVVDGPGTVFWNPASSYVPNSFLGTITINGGALVLKSSSGPRSTLLNNVPITDNTTLVFNRTGTLTLSGPVNRTGSVTNDGSGTVILAGDNTYAGATTTVSNGTLLMDTEGFFGLTLVTAGTLGGTGVFYGPITLNSGSLLAPGSPAGAIGTLMISNDLSIGGDIAMEVNKSLSPSNDFVDTTGVLTNTGTGTLTVANLGPALAVGDKFTPFSKPVQNGAAMTVTGSGVIWTNNLAVDGSISVSSLVPGPTLDFMNLGNSLQFTWAGDFKLQAQTNGLDAGLTTHWVDYPGGGTSGVTVPIGATNGTVFFRLVLP